MVNGLQFNYRMVGQHPIIIIQPSIYHLHGQWPSIQPRDGGATPHHHNSTKHIPSTWSMAINSTTGWWGNTPSSQFNQAYTIYMVSGIQSNTLMAGNPPKHTHSKPSKITSILLTGNPPAYTSSGKQITKFLIDGLPYKKTTLAGVPAKTTINHPWRVSPSSL